MEGDHDLDKIFSDFRFQLWNLQRSDVSFLGGNPVDEILNSYKSKNSIPESKKIWIDHTPLNFRYFNRLIEMYPSAKFVHIVRDPRAVVNSIVDLDWGPNTILTATRWWLMNITYGLVAELKRPELVISTKFEDILLNPEAEIKRICEFIDIPFMLEMLKGDATFLPNYTKNQHSLVGQKPELDKVYSWKAKLSEENISVIESECRELLLLFDYELLSSNKRIKTNRLHEFKFYLIDFLKSLRHKRRNSDRRKINEKK